MSSLRPRSRWGLICLRTRPTSPSTRTAPSWWTTSTGWWCQAPGVTSTRLPASPPPSWPTWPTPSRRRSVWGVTVARVSTPASTHLSSQTPAAGQTPSHPWVRTRTLSSCRSAPPPLRWCSEQSAPMAMSTGRLTPSESEVSTGQRVTRTLRLTSTTCQTSARTMAARWPRAPRPRTDLASPQGSVITGLCWPPPALVTWCSLYPRLSSPPWSPSLPATGSAPCRRAPASPGHRLSSPRGRVWAGHSLDRDKRPSLSSITAARQSSFSSKFRFLTWGGSRSRSRAPSTSWPRSRVTWTGGGPEPPVGRRGRCRVMSGGNVTPTFTLRLSKRCRENYF